ncbi:glutamate racemase [Rhodoligotrophos defluvii]|uniref:glutamate racemase n=1 Tax=Rhodoligotrophos defluvii TaxID=2561934 RepID=UPI0010C938B6|nr:glutamate racemase [Rhodoligotrophos defluvii]
MTDDRRLRILMFDSGTGGLTVARAVADALPNADLIYAADNGGFPYGAWAEEPLVERLLVLMAALIERGRPDVVVVACNTASTIAIWRLRERFPSMPFVGTVPAIKPAAALSKTGLIGVLATPGTVRREYTRALIETYASHCTVFLHGAEGLAAMAEGKLYGITPDPKALRREIRPAFRKRDGRLTDTVVLGCTHYPLLLEELAKAAPWPVTFLDPAPAIARRVVQVVAEKGRQPGALNGAARPGSVLLTARPANQNVLEAYARAGYPDHEVLAMA